MDEVLERYRVRLSTPIDYVLYNKITTISALMSQIISDHYTLYDADSLVINVKAAINNKTSCLEILTRSLQYLVITNEITKMYENDETYESDDNIEPNFSLPTNDFKVIVEAWKDYLYQSPTTKP